MGTTIACDCSNRGAVKETYLGPCCARKGGKVPSRGWGSGKGKRQKKRKIYHIRLRISNTVLREERHLMEEKGSKHLRSLNQNKTNLIRAKAQPAEKES